MEHVKRAPSLFLPQRRGEKRTRTGFGRGRGRRDAQRLKAHVRGRADAHGHGRAFLRRWRGAEIRRVCQERESTGVRLFDQKSLSRSRARAHALSLSLERERERVAVAHFDRFAGAARRQDSSRCGRLALRGERAAPDLLPPGPPTATRRIETRIFGLEPRVSKKVSLEFPAASPSLGRIDECFRNSLSRDALECGIPEKSMPLCVGSQVYERSALALESQLWPGLFLGVCIAKCADDMPFPPEEFTSRRRHSPAQHSPRCFLNTPVSKESERARAPEREIKRERERARARRSHTHLARRARANVGGGSASSSPLVRLGGSCSKPGGAVSPYEERNDAFAGGDRAFAFADSRGGVWAASGVGFDDPFETVDNEGEIVYADAATVERDAARKGTPFLSPRGHSR